MKIVTFMEGKNFALLIIVIVLTQSISSSAQKSPFQLKLGYEQLYVSSKLTDGIAQKTWIWKDPHFEHEYFTMRTSLTHALVLGIDWGATKWMSLSYTSKTFWRRYYVWSGTYLSEEWEGNEPGRFVIVPHVGSLELPSMFLGKTLSAGSHQFGIDFHHRISRNRKWRLHYYVSLNIDKYEKNLVAFDFPVYYGGEGSFTDIRNGQEVDYNTDGIFTLRAKNYQTPWRPSTSIAIAISKKMKNATGLRFEFGFRNILWTKYALLDENHWELDLTHVQYATDPDTGEKDLIYSAKTTHDFPLYLGGLYSNITFTFRPFRSARDKEDYVSFGTRSKNYFRRIVKRKGNSK